MGWCIPGNKCILLYPFQCCLGYKKSPDELSRIATWNGTSHFLKLGRFGWRDIWCLFEFACWQGATGMKKNDIGSIKKFRALALDLPTSTWSKWCHTLHIELIMERKWEIMSHSCTIIQLNIILITIWVISSQISKAHEFGDMMSYADSWWQCRQYFVYSQCCTAQAL